MEFLSNTKIQFLKYRKFFVVLSVILIAVGILEVFLKGNLNIGIDFAGGTQLILKFQEEPEIDELRGLLVGAGLDDAQIQRFGEADSNEVILKTSVAEDSEEGRQREVLAALDQRYNDGGAEFDLNRVGSEAVAAFLAQRDPDSISIQGQEAMDLHYAAIADGLLEVREEEGGLFESMDSVTGAPGMTEPSARVLSENGTLGDFALLSAENVGPQIGRELRFQGLMAVVFSLIGMLAYIWVRFELRFGLGALAAVFHDVIVVLGLYALLDFEFNLGTIAAFLTLIGYSVNDTVIIFDRVRENMRLTRRMGLEEVMNLSINQTLSRTVLTSGTTLLVVGSLLFLGGDVLRGFSFVLAVGIIVGTYSSVYVASPIVLLFEQFFGVDARAKRGTGEKKASKAA